MAPIRTLLFATGVATLVAAVPARAQDATAHGGHADSMMPGASDAVPPTEVGQAAFAAIAEIVRILDADPATDWSRVDIDALREHLRDMERVMMHAEAQTEPVEGGVSLVVTGEGEVREAIRRMLFAHAGALESELAVDATPAHHDQGLVLTVVARDPADPALVTRLRALGFAGLMAAGAHHQPHHLAIARGEIQPGAHEHH